MNTFDVESFISNQLSVWPLAASNYEALSHVEQRLFDMGDYRIIVQHNPARKRSTGATITKDAIAQRPCFLCAANRPQEQVGWQCGDYTILVNPYPIFSKHLTIVSNTHQNQHIIGRLSDMMSFAQMMPKMAVFFNGANSGASAPDHLHFQAAGIENWPLIADFENAEPYFINNIARQAKRLGRLVINIRTNDANILESQFSKILAQLGISDDMVNIVMHKTDDLISTFIIPRRAFRPWQYTADAEKQLLVSPASVEVSGVFITPVEEHYNKITKEDITSILGQVCFEADKEIIL